MNWNWKRILATSILASCPGLVAPSWAQTYSLSDGVGETRLASASCDRCGASEPQSCGCDTACDIECDPCANEPWRLFPELPGGATLTGWIAGGASANADNPASRYNGTTTLVDRNEVMLNQLYFVLEKVADTSDSDFAIGGRVDVLFGTDYIFTQAVGLETDQTGAPKWNNEKFYGVALPQAYAEIAAGDLSVKVGHFYTIIGNESVMAPSNFFYTHAYTMQYGEPFTHTGVLATRALTDQLSVTGGIHNGWDIFDRFSERIAMLAGFNWKSLDGRTALALGITSGDEFGGQVVPAYSNRTMYSLIGSHQVTDSLQYVVQHDHGWQKDYFSSGVDAEWYGLNQFLFYTINDCWKWGARAEWFRDDDGVRVTGVRAGNPAFGASFVGNFFEISSGLNWTPTPNLTVRPELRWDWFDGSGLPFDDGTKDNQFLAAFDAILRF